MDGKFGCQAFCLILLAAGPCLAAQVPGRLSGEFAATATGAATYTVPIEVAAGVNGLKPRIALSYSSQSRGGIAGVGWNLAGFSEISRCGLINAVDGHFQAVRYAAQDRFCLDGQPLILVAGTYGADGAEYRTEVHRYQKVVSFGVQGSGPQYFDVRDPDGLTYRYGNDADSRIEAPGTSNEIRTWALNEVEDKYYQRMLFTYTEDGVNGEYVPAEIRWTYGRDQTPNETRYRLVFSYESRPATDIRAGYVGGSPWRMSKRLTAIDYEHDAGSGFARVHRYSLSYKLPVAGGTQRSQLAGIQQCSPLDCLPSTDFVWQDGVAGFANETDGLPVDSASAVFGDYDGDGDADMFVPINGYWHLLLARNGIYSGLINTERRVYGPGYPLEYNGDGRTDLLTIGAGNTWIVYEATDTPGNRKSFTDRDTGIAAAAMSAPSLVDMDGDGLHELVYVVNNTKVVVRRNTGNGFGAEQPAGFPASLFNAYVRAQDGTLQTADFDGDGREDLLVARGGPGSWTWSIYLSNGMQFGPDASYIGYLYPTASLEDVIVLDDNGDGLSDLALHYGNQWSIRLSQGGNASGRATLVLPICAENITASSSAKTVAMDVNGDGRTDLVRPNGSAWRAHLSDGQCFSNTNSILDFAGTSPAAVGRLAPVDLNGDGYPDLLLGLTTNSWKIHLRSGPRADLMVRITDGLGSFTQPGYRALTGWSGYSATGAASAPLERVVRGGPLYVLSQYVASTGLLAPGADTYSVSFSYANGRVDMSGRGFLGFETTKVSDSRNSLVTETSYRQAFPFTGHVEKQTVWNGSRPVSVYDPSWNVYSTASANADAAKDYHFVYLAQSVSEEYEVDADGLYNNGLVRRTTRTLSQWNFAHGIATSEQTLTESPQDVGAPYNSIRSLTLNDALRTGQWCLGRPDRVNVTRSVGGGNSVTRTVQYAYLPGTCRLSTETSGPTNDPSQQLQTAYVYDTWGRVVSVTHSPGDGALPARQTTLTYDSVGYRPATESRIISNEPSHVISHTWHNGLGLEASRTDVQGRTTRWSYDGFGRSTVETRPTGGATTTYASCAACFPASAKYKVRTTENNGRWVDTFRDARDRVVGRASLLIDGSESRQAAEYDVLGRIARENIPYVAGATSYWVSYSYDLLNRVKSQDRPIDEGSPSGAVQRHTYSGLQTNVIDPQLRTTTFAYDAEGRLQAVNAPLNSSSWYGYTPFGELSFIADAVWNTTTFEYDQRGLRTAVNSPDLGVRHFTYNAFGKILNQTDARSPATSVSFTYDQLGRLRQRLEPEGSTTWSYFTAAGSSKGLLQTVIGPTDQSPTGFQETYAYDSLGHLQRTVTTVEGSSYQTDYIYDALGQLTSMVYPVTVPGVRPQFVYGYHYGYLASVTQVIPEWGNMPLYKVAALDALGRETHVRYNDPAWAEQVLYDSASMRIKAIRNGAGLNGVARSYAYLWDRAGNLTQRQDLNQGVTEAFTYDSLDRLLTAQRNGTQTLALSYSADGNIQTRSDVGTYTYNSGSTQPHGVRSITGGPRGNLSFTYDANGNMTNRGGASLTWTSYNLPKQINASGSGCSADCTTFTYGPNRQRIKQTARFGGVTSTIYYVAPHFEVEVRDGITRYRSHVIANGKVVYTQTETSDWLWEGYQVLRDYQHSVDTLGRVVGGGSDRIPMSFDAWGKRRNTDWSADPADARFADIHWTQRGYTDHAHLDNVKLIHMNGRVEDPILGRMLSPDLVLGVLSSPQTLNPYSYALNNPLSYTDPSGYFLHGLFRKFFYPFKQFVRDLPGNGNFGRLVIAAVASYFTTGAAYGAYLDAAAVGETATAAEIATANIVGYSAGGAVGGGISTGTLKGAVIGGLSGAAFGGVDVAFGSEYTLGRVAADATVGGASARLQGASFGRGFLFAGIGSGAEYAYRAAVGYGTEWGPGGPAQPKESLARPIKGADNVGFTLRNGIDDPALTSSESVFGEGAPLMRLANHVPGINAVAGLHDIWQRQTAILGGDLLRNVLNVPGMAVAVGGTLPALVRGVPVVDYGVDD